MFFCTGVICICTSMITYQSPVCELTCIIASLDIFYNLAFQQVLRLQYTYSSIGNAIAPHFYNHLWNQSLQETLVVAKDTACGAGEAEERVTPFCLWSQQRWWEWAA